MIVDLAIQNGWIDEKMKDVMLSKLHEEETKSNYRRKKL